MKRLSSRECDRALARLVRTRPLCAFDFDGTLAPIVLQPDEARMTTGIFRRLAQLAQLAPVAVISGRSLSDLRPRIPPDVQLCIGNHGSESDDVAVDTNAMRQTCRAWVGQLRERLGGDERDGIIVENKGLTISVHYRMARDRKRAAELITAWIEQLSPEPRVIGGKFVFNLLPQQARTKFDALADIARREKVDTVLFVGDDETDEAVFAQAPTHWITVRVERQRDSRARFYINDQGEMATFLDRLIAMLRSGHGEYPAPPGERLPPDRCGV